MIKRQNDKKKKRITERKIRRDNERALCREKEETTKRHALLRSPGLRGEGMQSYQKRVFLECNLYQKPYQRTQNARKKANGTKTEISSSSAPYPPQIKHDGEIGAFDETAGKRKKAWVRTDKRANELTLTLIEDANRGTGREKEK